MAGENRSGLAEGAAHARKRVRVNHLSVYASDPEKVARDLAHLLRGHAEPNGPLRSKQDGMSWVCFFNKEDARLDKSAVNLLDPTVTDFLEVYPRSYRLIVGGDGRADFEKFDAMFEKGAGVHFNLGVESSRDELETLCKERGLRCAWRGYLPLLDVWLEEDPALLVELVPPIQDSDVCRA